MAAGTAHSIALKRDGSVWVTGRNNHGQLGDESNTNRRYFVKVDFSAATIVAAGSAHSMVLKKDGSLWAAGLNSDGQLGDGNGNYTDTNGFLKIGSIGTGV